MKKLFTVLAILLAFTSLTILAAASAINPSIVINGYLPVNSSIFQIKHQNNELNLDTGTLLINESTNFTNNLKTSFFSIYITNSTAYNRSYTVKFKTDGFKKVNYDTNGTTILSYGPSLKQILLNINFSKASQNIAGSSFNIVNGLTLQSLEGLSYKLILNSGSNFDSSREVFEFYFYWNSSPEETPVPAGDYLATVTIENITQ
ncbi:MAG: hypothetical protein JJE21_02725 [Spirochaetaceae bacterium]|nr:hypothetical protein [Spirochaetaceae bacterium]